MAVVVGAVVIAGAVASWVASAQPGWLKAPLAVWGIPTAAIGLVMATEPGRRTTGRLLMAAGVTYYISVLQAVDQPVVFAVAFCTSYVWLAVVGQLVLRWTRPFLGATLYVVLTVAGYLGGVGTQTLRYVLDRPQPPWPPWWDEQDRPSTTAETIGNRTLVALIVVMFVIVLIRWALASGPRRRVTLAGWIVIASFAMVGFVVSLTTVFHVPARDRIAVTAAALQSAPIAALLVPRFRRAVENWMRWRVASSVLGLERDRELLNRPVDLERTLGDSLGDPGLRLYYPVDDGHVDVHGRPVPRPQPADAVAVTEVRRGDRLLALLAHDPALADSHDVAASVSAIAGLAIEATHLQALARAQTAAIAASRRRLATAAVEERRRIQRNLHDGAQQMLFSVLALLDQAQHDLTTGRHAVATVQSTMLRAHRQLTDAVGELRRLSHGLYPATLTEYGLAAALESLADTSPVPVDLVVPDRRWPGEIESTAYFVITECATNAIKHAAAGTLRITVVDEAAWLHVTVSDDGAGGAHLRDGGGLVNLRDRVAAVGGDFVVDSVPGAGTTTRTRLPLSAPPPTLPMPTALDADDGH